MLQHDKLMLKTERTRSHSGKEYTMASNKDKAAKDGGGRLRERYYEIRKNIKISPELEEATRERKPIEKQERDTETDTKKKIASPRRERDADL